MSEKIISTIEVLEAIKSIILSSYSGKDIASLASKITGDDYSYIGNGLFEVEYE